MEEKKVALVTGASAGIGKAAAAMLERRGWAVYGTSRKIGKGAVEDANGIKMIVLDVTDRFPPAARSRTCWSAGEGSTCW